MPESTIAERIKYMNPVLLEDVSRGLTASARRLLEYERYLDGLEHLRMRDKSLPASVEQQVARSIQGNLADAETAGCLVLELATELEDLGAFEAMFSLIDGGIAPGSAPVVLKEQLGGLEDWLEQRGMPSNTWRWALQYADWEVLGARVEAGAIVVTRGERTIGVISATRRYPPDAASFVSRALGLPPAIARAEDGGEPIYVSASEALKIAVRELVSFCRGRVQHTTLDGVQVLPTGVWWVVVVLIVAVVLIVLGGSLLILCGIGSITDKGLCAIAPSILLLGFLALVVAGVAAAPPAGEDPGTYHFPEDPDPPG